MKRGFSILEMSIVLMIIGLLIGGVLGAQAFLRNSELQAVLTDKDKYIAATNTFIAKYNGLPGDIKDATDMWGAAHVTWATCRNTVGTGTQTCNGNGDNNIGENASFYYEKFRFWQQLAIAGLIEGSYTGVRGPGGLSHAVVGSNVPKGKLKRSGFHSAYIDTTITEYFLPLRTNDALLFGDQQNDDGCKGPIMTAEEAWSIDKKADDGKPSTGLIQAPVDGAALAPDCSTTAVETTALYDTSQTGYKCSLAFMMQY